MIGLDQIDNRRVPWSSKRHCPGRFSKLHRLRRTPLIHWTYSTSLALTLLALPLLHAVSEHTYTNLYQRAVVAFEAANYMKPAETNAEDLTFKLAPLLMQEVVSGQSQAAVGLDGLATESGRRGDQLGALVISNGTVTFDGSRPTIYSELATISIHGKPHIQATYLWFYSVAQPASSNSALISQGIRLTLDSGGKPAIWEAMADTSGAQEIFVSESLESAVRAKFGPPLPGRRYAVERSVDEAPAVVVARVIDDGPIPMGPFVYLSAGTHCVNTVLCRCMPPQVRSLRSTLTYELAPSKDLPFGQQIPTISPPELAFSRLGDGALHKPLEDSLRLPDGF
jgi:hypothetical protein